MLLAHHLHHTPAVFWALEHLSQIDESYCVMSIRQFREDVKQFSQKLDTKSPETRLLYLMTEVGEVTDEVITLQAKKAALSDEALVEIKERIGLEIYDIIWNAVDLAGH